VAEPNSLKIKEKRSLRRARLKARKCACGGEGVLLKGLEELIRFWVVLDFTEEKTKRTTSRNSVSSHGLRKRMRIERQGVLLKGKGWIPFDVSCSGKTKKSNLRGFPSGYHSWFHFRKTST